MECGSYSGFLRGPGIPQTTYASKESVTVKLEIDVTTELVATLVVCARGVVSNGEKTEEK